MPTLNGNRAPENCVRDPRGGPLQVEALKHANEVRCARAALKRRIAAGRTDVSEVLLVPPLSAEKMALGELLMSQRGWGHVRSERFLRSAGLIETKTLGSLTVRQRVGLAALLTNDRSHLIGDPPSAFRGAVRRGAVPNPTPQ
jgi:hypothetical protein